MSATHIKTVMVELDGYATTGSRGGTVVEVIELLRNHETGVDTEGNYAVPSSLQKYVENFAKKLTTKFYNHCEKF